MSNFLKSDGKCKAAEGDTDIHNIDLVAENETEICEITSTLNISNQHGQGSMDINIKGTTKGILSFVFDVASFLEDVQNERFGHNCLQTQT